MDDPVTIAKGLTINVEVGDGAVMTIINPQSFADGGPEWIMRYGNPESIRYIVAAILESYDYLLSDDMLAREAVSRFRKMRAARAEALKEMQDG